MTTKQKKKETFLFALIGNPNCGKTTLFNRLTGSSQSVGNFPGVTVEKKEGIFFYENKTIRVIDLPGLYSLTPYSQEEQITRDFLLKESVDAVINVLDSTQIERSLYLTTQLSQLDIPVICALNMMDLLHKSGGEVDAAHLSKAFFCPFVPICAGKGVGLDDLIAHALERAEQKEKRFPKFFDSETEQELADLRALLFQFGKTGHLHFEAVKLLEKDPLVLQELSLNKAQKAELLQNRILKKKDGMLFSADFRYRFIDAVCQKAVKKGHVKISFSDKIDAVVTHKYLAFPCFFGLLFFMFFLTFGPLGSLLSGKMQEFTLQLGTFAEKQLLLLDASPWARSLVREGIFGSFGAVLSFLPQLVLLFFLLSFLEDSGYMARAAFIMDGILKESGLSGRSFVPMLLGFGCTVPAVMGTRILETPKNKMRTILMIPYMSCSAKLPVYVLFISSFFPKRRALVLFSLYLFGIFFAVFLAFLLKRTERNEESPAPFMMELPPYRMPTCNSLILYVFRRLKDFFAKAVTVLLACGVLVWMLQYFRLDFTVAAAEEESILAKLGMAIAPIFSLCGFGNWKAAVSLLSGLAAKESIVAALNLLDAMSFFTPLRAYSFLLFVLLYSPCVAALAAIYRETGSVRKTLSCAFLQTVLAFSVSALFYQIGSVFP